MEGRRKIPKLLIAVLLVAFFFAFQICASASDSDAVTFFSTLNFEPFVFFKYETWNYMLLLYIMLYIW